MRTHSSSVQMGVKLTLKSVICAHTSASSMAKIHLHRHHGGDDLRAPLPLRYERAKTMSFFDVNAREFYPQNHTENRAGVAQWVVKAEFNNAIPSAPGIVDDGGGIGPIDDSGNAGRIQTQEDDGGIEPTIDVGDAEESVDDDVPLIDDGKRNLKAEAVSLEHVMTHTPYNVHCPSCVRAKMLRRLARRVVHDPATMPKILLTSLTRTTSLPTATKPWA